MSATNSTTHYSLPSFLGTDKPAWLVDWNGAMATIDSAIYEAKQAADTAGTSASAVASDLATLSGTVSSQGSTISTLSDTLTTAVGNINTINGNITTINSLIGNGTPTTTDQTIIGAINEINAHVGTIDTALTVSSSSVDTGLTLIKYGHLRLLSIDLSGTFASGDTTIVDALSAADIPSMTYRGSVAADSGEAFAFVGTSGAVKVNNSASATKIKGQLIWFV